MWIEGPPGPQVIQVILKLTIFVTKQRSQKKIFGVNYYLLLNILQNAMNLASFSPGLSQLQNLSKKFLGLNMNCKQKEDWTI